MSFDDKSCDGGIELGDISTRFAGLTAAMQSNTQAVVMAEAQALVESDAKMQNFAGAERAFKEVIDKAIVKRLKPGADPERSTQFIQITMSMCVEGFIAALVTHQPEDFQKQVAFAIPGLIKKCSNESMARKQERFNAKIDASSGMDTDQKTKLKTLFTQNIENKLKSREAEDKGLRKGLTRQKGSLCLPLYSLDDIDHDDTLLSTLTGETP